MGIGPSTPPPLAEAGGMASMGPFPSFQPALESTSPSPPTLSPRREREVRPPSFLRRQESRRSPSSLQGPALSLPKGSLDSSPVSAYGAGSSLERRLERDPPVFIALIWPSQGNSHSDAQRGISKRLRCHGRLSVGIVSEWRRWIPGRPRLWTMDCRFLASLEMTGGRWTMTGVRRTMTGAGGR